MWGKKAFKKISHGQCVRLELQSESEPAEKVMLALEAL